MTRIAETDVDNTGRGRGTIALLRGGFASASLSIALVGLSFLISVALARMLGPDGFGAYSFAYALAMVLALPAHSGISQLVIRETAQNSANGQWGRVRGLWLWGNRAVVVLSIALALLLSGGSLLLGAAPEIMIAAALIPVIALGSLRGAALAGLHRVVLGQIPENVIRPSVFLILIFLAPALLNWQKLLPAQAMSLHIAAALLAFAVGVIVLRKVRPESLLHAEPQMHSGAWARAVLPLSLVGGMQLLINNTDVLMLGLLRSDAEVGVYRVIAQCSVFLILGSQALSRVVAPRFARSYEQCDLSELQHLAVTSARVGLLVALPVGAVFALSGEVILLFLFGFAEIMRYVREADGKSGSDK